MFKAQEATYLHRNLDLINIKCFVIYDYTSVTDAFKNSGQL
jgi:hypothetical protein